MALPEDVTRAEAMTRRLVHAFWRGDDRWIQSVAGEGFTGVGAMRDRLMVGIDEVTASMEDLPHVLITHEEYREVAQDGGMAVVVGRYAVRTDLRERLAFADVRRITAVWHWVDGGLKLQHVHASNAGRPAAGDGRSPMRMAGEAYRYLKVLVSQGDRRDARQVRDAEGRVHLLTLADIVYLEAKGQNTMVHGTSGEFRVHDTLSGTCARLGLDEGRGFVRVHRGFTVNMLYVVSVGDELLLSTGATVPVPRRRAAALRRYLAELRADDAG